MDVHPSLTHDLVLIGGGHTHALLLRKWGMDRLEGVRLTLINPDASAPYTGMLPGHIAGHYGRGALEMDLVRLARFAGAGSLWTAPSASTATESGFTWQADRPCATTSCRSISA